MYKDLLWLAFRNVFRNRRRSVLTTLVIALGIMFLFSVHGLLGGLQKELKENITKGEVGDIQITRKGFRSALPAKSFDYLFPLSTALKEKIVSVPHVEAITGRILFMGLVNHQKTQTTTPFMGIGISPEGENAVCPRLKDFIIPGMGQFPDSKLEKDAILSTQNIPIEEASIGEDEDFSKPISPSEKQDLPLAQSEYHQILIGNYMMKGFHTEKNGKPERAVLGDELVLITQDTQEAQRSLRGTLTGVVDPHNPSASKSILYMVLSSAQKLLNAEGQVSQILVRVDKMENRFEVARELNKLLGAEGLVAETWDDISTFFVGIMTLQDTIFAAIIAIIFAFVIVAIVITSLMTVAERTREIGTFMAIGFKRKMILSLSDGKRDHRYRWRGTRNRIGEYHRENCQRHWNHILYPGYGNPDHCAPVQFH